MQVQETEEKKEASQVDQVGELRRLAEVKHKTYSKLMEIHLNNNLTVLMSTNGVSYNKKNQARQAIVEAFQLVLDFGLGITDANITVQGTLGSNAAKMAAIFAQANDNRMLLLADRLNQENELNNNETATTSVAEKDTNNEQ
jgi:hypothetical protein